MARVVKVVRRRERAATRTLFIRTCLLRGARMPQLDTTGIAPVSSGAAYTAARADPPDTRRARPTGAALRAEPAGVRDTARSRRRATGPHGIPDVPRPLFPLWRRAVDRREHRVLRGRELARDPGLRTVR